MPFSRVKVDNRVVDFLGSLPPPTRDCLVKAFKKIRDGSAELSPDSILPRLQATEYCDYTILVSVTRDGSTAVIVDVVPARNALSGLW